jgi:quinol-cytochrome oxidoreductase complex cytochrome b subunit
MRNAWIALTAGFLGLALPGSAAAVDVPPEGSCLPRPLQWKSDAVPEPKDVVPPPFKPGEQLPQMRFFPNYILRDVLAWYVVLAVLAALAAFYPWELGTKADPFAVVPPGIRPEWYFLAMFHTLKLLPSHVLGMEGEQLGVVAFGMAAVFLILVPFLDRRASRGEPSRVFTVLAVLGLVYLVTFTIIGHYAK